MSDIGKKRSSKGEKWWKKYLHHTKCARCCCRCCVCWSWKKREPTKSSSSEEEGKKEQQFGIFIYCNVILESFFISVGWILNENVDGRGNIWKKRSNDGSEGRESSKHAWIVGSISCVNVNVEFSYRALWQDDVEIQFWKMNAISTRSWGKKNVLHLICYSEFDWVRDIFHNPKSNFMLSGATRSLSHSCHFISFTALLRIWQMAEFPPQNLPPAHESRA